LAVRLGEGKEHGKIKRGIKKAADVLTDRPPEAKGKARSGGGEGEGKSGKGTEKVKKTVERAADTMKDA
jgi:hypothetical protein